MILEYNLKLYIHCTDSRARIEDNRYNHANKESVAEYFEVFINTYERIINTHFPQIKRFFYPFTDDYEVKGYKLGILGEVYNENDYSYMLRLIKVSKKKVAVVEDVFKVFYNDYPEFCKLADIDINSSIKISGGRNLGSPEERAIVAIKSELKEILEKRKLLLDEYLLASRIEYLRDKIYACKEMSIDDLALWIEERNEEERNRNADAQEFNIIYNSVDLNSLATMINIFKGFGKKFEECLLPKGDANNYTGHIIDQYSHNGVKEYLEVFFSQLQNCFISLCILNFSKVMNLFPDYINYPYQYVVDVKFEKENERKWNSDHHIRYFYKSVDEPSKPLIRESNDVSLRDNDMIFELIEKSYTGKSYIRKISVCTALFTTILRGHNDSIIVENVFDKLKENLEYVVGKFR
jgi:hypothetical protein